MGIATANSSNAAQGWRGGKAATSKGVKSEHSEAPNMKASKSGGGRGCCYPTGNRYRGKHDDGSRQTRKPSGGMSQKHRAPRMGG